MSSFQSLDTSSIALVIFLIATLLAAGMSLVWRWERTEPGFGFWVAAQWALAFGMLLLFARALIPLWLSVALGNGGLFLMLILLREGIGRFLDRPLTIRPDLALAATATLWITANAWNGGHIELRIATVSAVIAVLALRCAAALGGQAGGLRAAARFIQWTLAGVAALMLIRSGLGLFGDPVGQNPFQQGLAHASIFLSVSFAAVALPFMLMLLNGARNMERLQQARLAAESASETDVLTGLPNRRGLFRRVRELDPTRRIGVCLLDLDHFKAVNDAHGHDRGDRVLRELAGLMPSAAPGCLHARLGGEEFVVVVPDGGRKRTMAIAEALRTAIEDTLGERAGLDAPVTTSIGTSSGIVGRFEELLTTADLSLYRAKHAGRNRVLGAGPGATDRTPSGRTVRYRSAGETA